MKHKDITDSLILDLVRTLDKTELDVEAIKGDFEYYTVEPIIHEDKPYRLVLVLCIWDDYLGVINAFRVKRRS